MNIAKLRTKLFAYNPSIVKTLTGGVLAAIEDVKYFKNGVCGRLILIGFLSK